MSGMLRVTMPGIAHEETGLGRSNSRRENGKPLYFTATRFAGQTRRWNCGAEELGSRESPAPPTALTGCGKTMVRPKMLFRFRDLCG